MEESGDYQAHSGEQIKSFRAGEGSDEPAETI